MTWQILGRRTIFTLSMAFALAACGQKGALYIPTDPEGRDRGMFPRVLVPDTNANTPSSAQP